MLTTSINFVMGNYTIIQNNIEAIMVAKEL